VIQPQGEPPTSPAGMINLELDKEIVETEAGLIPLTHIYMTGHFHGLVQTLS